MTTARGSIYYRIDFLNVGIAYFGEAATSVGEIGHDVSRLWFSAVFD